MLIIGKNIVCDWYHNAPQLFGLSPGQTKFPSSCSKVALDVEYTS